MKDYKLSEVKAICESAKDCGGCPLRYDEKHCILEVNMKKWNFDKGTDNESNQRGYRRSEEGRGMNDKKELVLKELQPIADLLNINIDYVIEDVREYLVCNGQRICTNATSVEGIKQEFIGYVFLRVWKDRWLGWYDKQTRNHIKQYWYDDEFRQPYYKGY